MDKHMVLYFKRKKRTEKSKENYILNLRLIASLIECC